MTRRRTSAAQPRHCATSSPPGPSRLCAKDHACIWIAPTSTVGLKCARRRGKGVTVAGHTRGTGTIYRRGSVWWLQYFANGRQINESTYQSDETEAGRQLRVKVGEELAST